MERLETANSKSYLFCEGFDLLGGILRKLESTCLERFFLWACKSIRAWREDEVLLDGQECTCIDGRNSALALVDQVNNSRARAVSAMDQLFMVMGGSWFLWSRCLLHSESSKAKDTMFWEWILNYILVITVWNDKDNGIRCHIAFMWDHVLNFLTAASCIVRTMDLVKTEAEISERSCDKPRDATISLSF